MTILGPLLMASMFIVPIFVAKMSDETKIIQVVDESGIFFKRLTESDDIKFDYSSKDIKTAKAEFHDSKYNAILYIPNSSDQPVLEKITTTVCLYSEKQPGINVKIYIENALKKDLQKIWFAQSGISKDTIAFIDSKTNVEIKSVKLSETDQLNKEEKTYPEVSIALGIFSGILIYFFVFMYGAQVMRGVIEEKTSRIVEVIISSVKPFQLMMGKIIGVAMVGLTQFLLWVILTTGIVVVVQSAFADKFTKSSTHQMFKMNDKVLTQDQAIKINNRMPVEDTSPLAKVNEMLATVNFPLIIIAFIFYFICGYLLYASLFAAIGSAVDSEADTQQFMMPVTIPLVFSIVMLQFVINNPEGPVAFWLSIIPLTSPVIMMVRIPFGVPVFEIILSMSLLIIAFIFSTWIASKIYRTGILMYGKKVSYKEMWKWLKYKK